VHELGVPLGYVLIGAKALPILHQIVILFPLQLLPHLLMALLPKLFDLAGLDSRPQLRSLIDQLHPLLQSLVPFQKILNDEFEERVHGEAVDAWLLEVDVLEDREDDVLDDAESEDLEINLEYLAFGLGLTLLIGQYPVERSLVVVGKTTVVVVTQEIHQIFRGVSLLYIIRQAVI
jgi:hypothetical protein